MVSIMEKGLKNGLTDTPNKTTIKVSQELRSKLAEIGNKDETFEDVIKRLIRRAEPERSGEIVTSKSSVIQYKRRKEFIELITQIENKEGNTLPQEPPPPPLPVGIEYEYNTPSKKEGEWELDIEILKVYYEQKVYNPSEFFGVDNEHKYLSDEFIKIYFEILTEIFIKEFGITQLRSFSLYQELSILKWRKIYYENKLSEESFINDVEDVLRNFSERKIDSKTRKQLKSSIAGH